MDSEFSIFPKGSNNSLSLLEIKGLTNRTDYTGHSLLHWAVHNGDLKMCRNLLSNGCQVEKQDSLGTTPLMLASYNGFLDIVKLLFDYGAKANTTNDYGANALTMACANDHVEILKFLILHFKEVTKETKVSWPQKEMIISAACGSYKCVEFYCKHDNECINSINETSGMNALMLAEAGGFEVLREKLASLGAQNNPKVKPFLQEIHTPLLLTPIQNFSFLFPSNPYCSPFCFRPSPTCSTANPVFLFPPSPELLSTKPSCSTNAECFPANLLMPLVNNSEYNHPLTPTLCFSPQKNEDKLSVQKKNKPIYSWLKKLKRKRSRSLENLTKVKRRRSSAIEHDNDNILDYILSTANLSEYKSCFVEQEVTFRTFLTLNEDELIEVGIKKSKVRKKFLKLIHHYKRIFFSQV